MRVSNQKSVTILSASSTQLLDQNMKRVQLIFSPPAAGAYEVSLTGPAVLGGGMRVSAGMQPLKVSKDDIGETIHGVITAISEGANVTVGITEEMDT